MSLACVDVVVVAYWSGEDLRVLLEDLPVMSRLPYELHVFDNTGNPKTLTMAWNDLAAQGRAEFLAFLNTDIRLSPGWDERLVDCLCSSSDAGVVLPKPVGHDWPELVGGGPMFSNPGAAPPPPREAMEAIAAAWESAKDVYSFGGSCDAAFYFALMRRSLWTGLKGFDERFRLYGQDHDFQRRALGRHGRLTVRSGCCPVWHRCGGCVREAGVRGEVDLGAEMRHQGVVKEAIMSGRMKEWDLLTEGDRAGVRSELTYNAMPRPARARRRRARWATG